MIFSQKRFVITQSAKGIGKRTAQRLLENGARVMISDKDCDQLNEAERELRSFGDVHVCLADMHRLSEAETLAQSASFKLGGIDVWMNISGSKANYAPFMELDAKYWKTDIDSIMTCVFNGCKAILPHFRENGGGRIVNTVYEPDFVRRQGRVTCEAAKAGVVEFTKGLAREVGQYNIFVNSVSFGRTLTENQQMIEATEEHQSIHQLTSQHALRRLGDLDDAANALMFLASDQASWITGHNLISNGGLSER